MEKKDDRRKKYEDDEYSILSKGGYEESMLKWKSFHKNLDTATVKSYYLDGILRDDTYLSKRNDSHLNTNEQKSKYLDEKRSILNTRNPVFDDMSILKESNISFRRYIDSIKPDRTIFKPIEEKKDITKQDSISKEFIPIEEKNLNIQHENISEVTLPIEENNNYKTRYGDISKINRTIIDKKKVLKDISQVKDDLEKCTNLLKKKGLINNKNVGSNDINYPNNLSENTIHTENNLKLTRKLDEDIELPNETFKKRKTCDKTKAKEESIFLGNINNFHSSLMETKRRIDEAIEEVKDKENNINREEKVEELNDIYLNKIEEHINIEQNYRKEIFNLEKTVRLQGLEISKLKSKINSMKESQTANETRESKIKDGLNIINVLRKDLNDLDQEMCERLKKSIEDKKCLEQEVVALKDIINKLVEKIKKLKNKECN